MDYLEQFVRTNDTPTVRAFMIDTIQRAQDRLLSVQCVDEYVLAQLERIVICRNELNRRSH